MRKGINRIIFGALLILLQILSIIGNSYGDTAYKFDSLPNLLAFSIGYLLFGICGTIFLVFGIKTYKTGDTANLILHDIHKSTKILNYILGSLMLLLLLLGIISDFGSMLTITGIMYVYAAISMIIYLWFHQGKKPSSLYAASMIATGSGLVLAPLGNLSELLAFLISVTETGYYMYVILILLSMACGVTTIAAGILIYRGTFSIRSIKTLGLVSFILFFISRIDIIFDSSIIIDFYSICYLLQFAILIYTYFVTPKVEEE